MNIICLFLFIYNETVPEGTDHIDELLLGIC